MLYLFLGDGSNKQLKAYKDFCTTLHNKRPHADYLNLEGDEAGIIQNIEHAIYKQGLFDNKSINTLNGLFDNTNIKKYIIDKAQALTDSPNAFVCHDKNLSSKEIEKLKQAGATVYLYTDSRPHKKKNLFYLADLLTNKKKSTLWLAYQEELALGTSAEELTSILMYQARALHHSLNSETAPVGIKAFVYNKCRRSPWSKKEAQTLHLELIELYHQSRRGGSDLGKKIELLILNLS